MAYCRWSHMNYQCDVYAYDSAEGGVHICVATRRRVLPDDMPPNPMEDILSEPFSPEEFKRKYRRWNRALEACEMQKIGLPADGRSWLLDYEDAAAKIAELRAMGYNIPEGVEDEIAEDGRRNEASFQPTG